MKRGLAFVGLLLAAFGAHAQDGGQRLFPKASGQDLNGRDVTLPSDFPGPASLVFVAFERQQQDDVDSWHSFVQQLKSDNPALAAWELPTLARSWLLMRFIIDNGMRSGIRDTAARAATITLYIDVKEFTRALGLQDTNQIAVFVVTPSGEILARVIGRFTEEGAAEISRALNAVR
jgi:hypothetical protein